MKRDAQCSMAACTRASGTGHHLLGVVAEVAEQDGGGVAPRDAGDRSAGVGGAPGLVQAWDRHAVVREARDGAVLPAERQATIAAVERAVNHVRVRALDVGRALDERGDDRLVAQVREESPYMRQLPRGDLLLVAVPAAGRFPCLGAQQLDRVVPL